MKRNCHKRDCRKDAFDEQMIKRLPVMITESYKNDRMIATKKANCKCLHKLGKQTQNVCEN